MSHRSPDCGGQFDPVDPATARAPGALAARWQQQAVDRALLLLTFAAYGAVFVGLSVLILELAHNARWAVNGPPARPSYVLQALAYNWALPFLAVPCVLGYAALDYVLAKKIALAAQRLPPALFARIFSYGAAVFIVVLVLLWGLDGYAFLRTTGIARSVFLRIDALATLPTGLFLLLGIGAEYLEKRQPRLIWVKCIPPVLLLILLVIVANYISVYWYGGYTHLWNDLVYPSWGFGEIVSRCFLCGLACCAVCFGLEWWLGRRMVGSARLLCALLWLAACGPALCVSIWGHVLGMVMADDAEAYVKVAACIGVVAATLILAFVRLVAFWWRRRHGRSTASACPIAA